MATCSILCTADYCLDTTEQLEAKLEEKIDNPLKEQINFSQEQDGFHGKVLESVVALLKVLTLLLLKYPIYANKVHQKIHVLVLFECQPSPENHAKLIVIIFLPYILLARIDTH